MRRVETVDYMTKFTGDISEIETAIREYKKNMQDVASATKSASLEISTDVKNIGDRYQATVRATATGTLRMQENMKDVTQATQTSWETFKTFGSGISSVAGSIASFGQLFLNLQMPMIWMEWRQEQLMVTTRRIKELTDEYHESLASLGPAAKDTQKSLAMLNEAKALATVYTQREERAQMMMNVAYITSIAQVFPATINLIESLNKLRSLSTVKIIAETVATWANAAAHWSLASAKAALAPYMAPIMIGAGLAVGGVSGYMLGRSTVPATAKGQFMNETVMKEGFAYLKRGDTVNSGNTISIHVYGGDARSTATEIYKIIDSYFSKNYYSHGMKPI